MKRNKNPLIAVAILICMVSIYFFCGDPVRPDFDKEPVIKNDSIHTIGTPEYGEPYSLYIKIAEGSEPLAYHWIKDTTELTSINNDTLHFTKLSFTDSGIYRCIVTNEFGADTSLQDTLKVTMGDSVAPVILNNKALLTFGTEKVDSMYGLYLQTIGSDTLYYVWYKNGSLLNNAKNDTLLFNALEYSDSGYYYCIVTNNFGSAISNNDTITLGQQQNRPPQWTVDTMHLTVHEAVACSLVLTDSCSDPDGDAITYSLKSGAPACDTILMGKYYYTPGYNDSGVYHFTIQASDIKNVSPVVVKMVVLNTNRMPQFLDSMPDDFYHVNEGGKLVIAFKAQDRDGDTVIYSLPKNELPGTTVFNDSQLVWQASANDSGYYKIEIHAHDLVDTAKAPVTVAVGAVNQKPEITIDTLNPGDTIEIREMKTLSFKVTVTDPDTGNHPVLLSPLNKPANASFDTATGIFSFTPSFSLSNGITNYVFTNIAFLATDNINAMGRDTFVINIEALDSNSAPVWLLDSIKLPVTEGSTLACTMNDLFSKDNEGEKVTFSRTFGTFDADTSQWSWKPDFSAYHGNRDTVCILTATDNHLPTASSPVRLILTVSDSTPAVTLGSPTHISYNSIGIFWTQSADPDFSAYKIFYSKTSPVTESSLPGPVITNRLTTTDTLTGLSENTHYYVKVFVYNTHLSVAGSNEIDATTPVLGAPVIIVNIPTVYNDSASMYSSAPTMSGTASADAGIATVNAKINGNAVAVTGSTSWSFSVATQYMNSKQWNRIEITATDNASKSKTDTVFVFYKPVLASPVKPTITDTTNRLIALSWNEITDCGRYLVYRSRDGVNYSIVKDTTGTGLKDTLLDINTQYWYKIRGYYSAFGVTDSTSYSLSNSAKTENWFKLVFDYKGNGGIGKSIQQTPDSGYIVLGQYSATTMCFFVLKINKSGDTIWTKKIEGSGDNEPWSMQKTDDGCYIICGTNTLNGNNNLFLIKIDLSGNIKWQKSPCNPSSINSSYGFFAQQTFDGGYIVFSQGGLADESGAYFIKANSSGDYLGSKAFSVSSISTYQGWCGLQTSDSSYVIGVNTIDGAWLTKINEQGDSLWTRTISGKWPNSIIQTSDGGFALCGVPFGGTKSILYKADYWGYLQWDKDYFNEDNSSSYCLQNVPSGGFVVTGYNSTNNSAFLIKTNPSGDISGANTFNKIFNEGTTSEGTTSEGKCVQVTVDGGYIVAGSVTVNSKLNVFIIKTDENGNVEE